TPGRGPRANMVVERHAAKMRGGRTGRLHWWNPPELDGGFHSRRAGERQARRYSPGGLVVIGASGSLGGGVARRMAIGGSTGGATGVGSSATTGGAASEGSAGGGAAAAAGA